METLKAELLAIFDEKLVEILMNDQVIQSDFKEEDYIEYICGYDGLGEDNVKFVTHKTYALIKDNYVDKLGRLK